jgi:hypothetical protein
MKLLIENWKNYTKLLTESSLSRLHKHMMEHDCIIISAYRNDPLDNSKCPDEVGDFSSLQTDDTGRERTTKEINKMRSSQLKAILLDDAHGVTEVLGSYIENFTKPEAVEVKERSLFVVNLTDDPNFLNMLSRLGRTYCQDSILFIPKGGKGAYLLGTNNSEFPGLNNKVEVGDFKGGSEAEFMTRVGDRPFAFKESKEQELQLETFSGLSRTEKMAVRSMAKNARKLFGE